MLKKYLMKITILRHNAEKFFIEAAKLEDKTPNGHWRYFKFNSKNEILGLYEGAKEGFDSHPDFFKYFFGQFSPNTTQNISIHQADNFEAFCLTLNSTLIDDQEILDLSCSNYWIWTKNGDTQVPPKLKDFLSFKP